LDVFDYGNDNYQKFIRDFKIHAEAVMPGLLTGPPRHNLPMMYPGSIIHVRSGVPRE
jgi:hypothetical protein